MLNHIKNLSSTKVFNDMFLFILNSTNKLRSNLITIVRMTEWKVLPITKYHKLNMFI